MTSLTEKLNATDRAAVVRDATHLVDEEVARKSGLSGMALKAGFKVIKAIKPGIIEEVLDHLLDEFSNALNPLYGRYLAQEQDKSFGAFLGHHEREATQALLNITDARARRTQNKAIKSTYDSLRGQAERHVAEALPGLGRLIDRHAPRTPSAAA